VEEVVEDIRRSGARRILIVDDNIFSDKQEAVRLFEALIPLKIKWGCQISIDVARDEALLDLISRSGCILFMIGFESLQNENLKQMKKGSHVTEKNYSIAIEKIKNRGIMIYASFVFGYDFDTPKIFDATLDFALKNKFALVNFNTLNPMPGTKLYERLKSEGRLFDEKWWLKEQYKYGEVMFQPKHMSPRQLKEECIRARFAFSRYSSILRRSLDRKANGNSLDNWSLFWIANLITRREYKNKMNRIR
jgi:radical SAM superfamily enzyme YgiQ (UPF0313 family)